MSRRALGIAVVAIFGIGLACRVVALGGVHDEGDEVVYEVLVGQLESGRGYTLQGTPLIGQGWSAEQYGQALFFHPPGGIALFWLLHAAFGEAGYPAVQLLSYAVFYAALLWLAAQVLVPFRGAAVLATALLAAFTPLMTHVTSRYWLDGPVLAFTTLACALFVLAVRRERMAWAVVAGGVLGYASLIKTTAFLVVPGVALLAWVACAPRSAGTFVRLAVCFVGLAALIQLPWELWQWAVVGSPFPAWAGKPSRELVMSNPYVYYLTVVRSPWVYMALLPRVVWTLIPSLACLTLLDLGPRERRLGWSLVGWVALIVGTHVALGFIGYSKVLRYVILVTPATVLLFGLVVGDLARRLADREGSRGPRAVWLVLATLAGAGVVLEVAQGIFSPIVDARLDIIRPLL